MVNTLKEESVRPPQEETLKEEASRLLKDGYDGVIGLRKKWGHVGPYLFSQPEELQDLVLEPRYPLAKFISLIQKKWADKKLGAIVRGCDERFLRTLEERGAFNKDGFAFIGIVCSPEQAEECNCEKPIYSTFNCTGCWKCIETCPKEAITKINVCPIVLPNEFDAGMSKRKAVYRSFPQAVPNKFVRDAEHCLKITGKLDCKGCENVCLPEAIQHDMEDEYLDIDVGAIVVATGFDIFDPTQMKRYGYKRYDNVYTSLEAERMISSTGPTGGHVQLKDGSPPRSVAIVHCVGSRDENYHEYCSRVCCMHGLKQAHLIKEKTGADVYQMYIDMRCFGKGYEEFYKRISDEGINFIRGKVTQVTDITLPEEEQGKLVVVCEDTLLGSMIRVPVDMVILSVALEPRLDAAEVAGIFSLEQGEDGFFKEKHYKIDPLGTLTDGIYLAGCCQGPKDIPDTVAQAIGAAAKALALVTKGEVGTGETVAAAEEK